MELNHCLFVWCAIQSELVIRKVVGYAARRRYNLSLPTLPSLPPSKQIAEQL